MSDPAINRREFAKTAGAGTAAVLVCSHRLQAVQEPAEAGHYEPVPVAAPKPQREEPPSQADLLLAVIERRYPDSRLTPGVLREIRRDMQQYISRGRRLSGYPLKNSDEPAFVFAAYRSED